MTNPTPADVERLIAEAEAALEGVTPGPWRVCIDDDGNPLSGRPSVQAPDECDCAIVHWDGFVQQYWRSARGDKEIYANAAFIAWCRQAVPALIAALRAMQAERDMAAEGWEEATRLIGLARQQYSEEKARAEAAEAKLAEVEKERDSAKRVGITAIEVAEAHIATLTAQVEAMRGALGRIQDGHYGRAAAIARTTLVATTTENQNG